jgi:hypothetical protein
MKYETYRESIKSGDILAFSHEGWKSWSDIKTQAVRIFTRSNYSHVGVAVVLAGRVMVLENVVPYARLYPLSQRGSFYHIGMKDVVWTGELEEKAFSYIGSKYSQWQAIKAFFVNLGRGNTSQCAALVSELMYAANIYMGDRQTPDAIVLQSLLLGYPLLYVENKR